MPRYFSDCQRHLVKFTCNWFVEPNQLNRNPNRIQSKEIFIYSFSFSYLIIIMSSWKKSSKVGQVQHRERSQVD